jgi:hypothetical protein
MKNRIYCTFILAIITVMVCAQTEQPKDSIKGHRETVPEIRQGLHINDRNIQTDGTLPDNTRQAAAGDSMTFRIPYPESIPSGWIVPQLGTYSNPFIWDYDRYYNFNLSPNSNLSTFSNYNTYLSIGTIVKAGAAYSFSPNDRWIFSGGVFVAKYTLPSLRIPTAPMAG